MPTHLSSNVRRPHASPRPASQADRTRDAATQATTPHDQYTAVPHSDNGQGTASQSSFAALGASPHSLRALARMGITEPTLIQARAIPPLVAGRDVIGQSRTGSGKTIAFGLPLVERLDPRLRRLQALVLVPTRELASQVAEVLAALDGGRGLRVAQLIGGRALGPQREALLAGAQIAVGAPGRVLDHLRQGNLDPSALRLVVLDEADQMLDAGFAPDVERILARTPATRQLALFSATLPAWTTELAQRYLHDPVSVDAGSPQTRPAPAIAQTIYLVPQGQRLHALMALLDRRRDASGATLVFGRTKHGVRKLARQLAAQGYPVAALQGNMSQNARERVLADFRSGQVPVLLATNVAARGLDVLSIEQVINYELPESAELFTHRVGRTGRMDREGEAITLLTPDDAAAWQKIKRDLGVAIQPRAWPHAEMPLPEAPAGGQVGGRVGGHTAQGAPAARAPLASTVLPAVSAKRGAALASSPRSAMPHQRHTMRRELPGARPQPQRPSQTEASHREGVGQPSVRRPRRRLQRPHAE